MFDEEQVLTSISQTHRLLLLLLQVVHVKSSVGWSFEFSLRPSSDLALYDKYNIAEYIRLQGLQRARGSTPTTTVTAGSRPMDCRASSCHRKSQVGLHCTERDAMHAA
jgi:hypothetical protein